MKRGKGKKSRTNMKAQWDTRCNVFAPFFLHLQPTLAGGNNGHQHGMWILLNILGT